MGKGDLVQHPIISDTDLKSLYSSMHLSINTPQDLFNKVQVDIRMFFCRQRNENMHTMTKDMFHLKLTRTLVKKSEKVIDELTKNHRLHKETSSGIMPEIKGYVSDQMRVFLNLMQCGSVISLLERRS